MKTEKIQYQSSQTNHVGFMAYDDKISGKRPAVLVVHDWSGCNDFAKQKAEMLAQQGYVGLAVDMYGNGIVGTSNEQNMALMEPLSAKRTLIVERLNAALKFAQQVSVIDADNIAIMGFCFGGLCALDLARSGAQIKGAISFHGLLASSPDVPSKNIKAKILALHGYEDPLVPSQQLNDFYQEMTQAKVDWQVHCYGKTQHSFTNPNANNPQFGLIYNPVAERRSLQALRNFLDEIFAKNA